MTVVELGALAVVVSAPPAGRGRAPSCGATWLPLGAAVALPVAYEVWRMAYFALIVSNTALAKSASASWWSQGFTYVWNFVAPYTLWVPLALAIPLRGPPVVGRWWRNNDRTGVVVLLTPVAAAAVDILYVARVGGDYQHARLLLPGFMSLCLPISCRCQAAPHPAGHPGRRHHWPGRWRAVVGSGSRPAGCSDPITGSPTSAAFG